MTADAEPASERLERALEIFLQNAAAGASGERLLAEHDDLRDLLEPMVAGASARDGGDTEVLGDFRLVRELGRGGMGIVYAAWQRSLDRPVALKVLSPALMASSSAIARFRREAAAVGRLRHPGIVEVHGFGSDGDRHWFAMGLVDGEPLTSCRERFRDPVAAVGIAVQVLEALQHAHGAGLVHRDVKPGNVIVRADGSAVLTDFGLAHDAELPSVTTDGSFLGTLDYASPEQVQGARADARTDVWAVGVVLHELLAGARPFARGTATATMKAILTEDAPDLRRVVGADLAAIVQHALHKEPKHRYGSAAAFLADLRSWQVGGVIAARAPGLVERALRQVRAEPWRATAALLVVVLLPVAAGSIGWLWANAPRLAAAEAAERAAVREAALTAAWLALAEEDVAPGLQALDALAASSTDLEVAVARTTLLLRAGRRDAAQAALAPVAAEPAAKLVALQMENRDATGFDFARAEGHSPIECFVLGLLAYEQVHVHKLDRAFYAIGSRWLGTAVAMSPEPRAAFLFWWMVLAARAVDGPAFAAAFAAYERHFPGSHGLQLACVLCASALPVERGLLILGSVDLAAWPRAHFALALLLERAGRAADSERAYRAGLAVDPNNRPGWLQLSSVLDQQKKFAEAAAAARAAIGVDEHSAEAWSRLGTSLLQAGQPAEARAALERAMVEGPTSWRTPFNLGLLLRDAGEPEAALAAFDRAAELAPLQPEPHVFAAHVLRSLERAQEAAIEDVRALQCGVKDWRQWMAVGIRLSAVGLGEAAVVYAARVTELAPEQPLAWSRFAEVLLDVPVVDAPRALAAAKRGDELANGADARGVWILARAEAAAGDRAAAIARLDGLLAGSREVPSAVRKLAEAELAALRAPR